MNSHTDNKCHKDRSSQMCSIYDRQRRFGSDCSHCQYLHSRENICSMMRIGSHMLCSLVCNYRFRSSDMSRDLIRRFRSSSPHCISGRVCSRVCRYDCVVIVYYTLPPRSSVVYTVRLSYLQ